MSRDAAVAASSLGYTNIFLFPGGFPEWLQMGYPVQR